MDQGKLGTNIIIPRAADDRRAAPIGDAPYFTDEGFVLFDRRETGERRHQPFATAGDLHQLPTVRPGSGEDFKPYFH